MEKNDQSTLMAQFEKVMQAMKSLDTCEITKLKGFHELASEMLTTYKEVEIIRAAAEVDAARMIALGQAATSQRQCPDQVTEIVNFLKSKGPQAG